MTFSLLYITAPHIEEAQKIARILLEEKLAKCINVFPEVLSMYLWEGQIEQHSEVILIVKTLTEKVAALKHRILECHSYECPCVLVLTIEEGNDDYLNWLKDI